MDTTSLIKTYKKELAVALDSIPVTKITEFYNYIEKAHVSGGTIFVCANGGSVGAVHNFVTDMNLHPFTSSDKTKSAGYRNRFHCVNLCSDAATITGIMNDKGPDYIYSEQLKYQFSNEGDNPYQILLCMSGSGNSPNILRAVEAARDKATDVILITRNRKAIASMFSNLTLCIDAPESQFPGQRGSNNNNFYFEDILFSLTHMVCGMLKRYIGND